MTNIIWTKQKNAAQNTTKEATWNVRRFHSRWFEFWIVFWIIIAFQIMISTGSSFSPFHSVFCCFHGDGDKRDKYVVVRTSLSQLSTLTLRLPYVITSLNTTAEDGGEIRTQYKHKSLWQLFTFTVTCWQRIWAKSWDPPIHNASYGKQTVTYYTQGYCQRQSCSGSSIIPELPLNLQAPGVFPLGSLRNMRWGPDSPAAT